jgi:hypothetical protein
VGTPPGPIGCAELFVAVVVGLLPPPRHATALWRAGATFDFFGGVPRELLFEMREVVVADQRLQGGPLVENVEFARFAQHWQFRLRACRPYRAKTKGKVKCPIRYVREDFFYGRTLINDEDTDAQSQRWLQEVANVRPHGITRERPIKRFQCKEQAALTALAAPPCRSLVLAPPPDGPRHSSGLFTLRSSVDPLSSTASWLPTAHEGPPVSRRDQISATLADLEMPGALEAADEVLSEADSGSVTAAEAVQEILGAQISLRNNRRLQAAILTLAGSENPERV